ncbi:MAG: dihydropteroate synthase [Gammaproteobacteria bacterium]|nr:dihydropteroate synthase [Gammaproteobacteria bacterium]
MVEALVLAGKTLDLSCPQVMGILNVTPDSFSDGGLFFESGAAVDHAHRMVEEGAAIIDVGGESTRPDAAPVPVQEELRRVIPVIERICREVPVPVSVDTSKPEVMRAAVDAGAAMINDIRALRLDGALQAAVATGVPVCLMHMQGEPSTMQRQPHYGDVVEEVKAFLAQRAQACVQAGIPRRRILIDPGFGFGKTVRHNLLLLKQLGAFRALGLPLLVGISRKSMIGAVLGAPPEERMYGSLALAALAAWQGASIVRVHDVRATVEALRMCAAVRDAESFVDN